MDASDRAKHSGNGHVPDTGSLPSAAVVPQGAPVSSSPEGEAPAGSPPSSPPRDDKGRALPGHSLNPKGRPPGVPNRNAALNHGFAAFRASPELCKAALKKYKIRIRGVKAEHLLPLLAFAKSIIDGDDALLLWCGEKLYVSATPPAVVGGINIHNNPQASATHSETHNHVEKLLAQHEGREGIAQFAERLAACGALPGEPRHVRQ